MEHTLEKSAPQVIVPAIAITDGELLMRFAHHGDEQAFATIVEKHGRLVWAVCWQVLREHHAIEDAFQSTFFILAKRAHSIRSCDSLCGWLYRVAYRTALRARPSLKAVSLSTLGADVVEAPLEFNDKLRAIHEHEQRAVLLEELQALPRKYQQPLALCYLEGKTRRAVAEELGCSLETVKGRLARGRQVLRHRLIRRGVSLSLAMSAMTLPVKSAAAAVTPSLTGITASGATAWAAGTLTAAKITGSTGAAKTAATVSTQVIHLAQQGTIAMTIASFAKPAVVAVALLGAVSAALAVDGKDAPPAAGKSHSLELSAAAVDSEPHAMEGAAATEFVARQEASTTDPPPAPRAPVAPSRPAPPRAPQPTQNYPPVQIPVQGERLGLAVPSQPDLKLQLKIAELEAAVAQLELESKELEIEAMRTNEEAAKKAYLQQAREKMTLAEAERIKIQLEQQRAQIEHLKNAIEAQAQQATESAAQAARGAEMEFKRQGVHYDPANGQTISVAPHPVGDSLPTWEQSIEAQQGVMSLKPGDRIMVDVAHEDGGSEFPYTVEPMGTVALGASYGRVDVKGLSILETESVIRQAINKVTEGAKVQVTYLHPAVPYPSPYAPPTQSTEPQSPRFIPGQTDESN